MCRSKVVIAHHAGILLIGMTMTFAVAGPDCRSAAALYAYSCNSALV